MNGPPQVSFLAPEMMACTQGTRERAADRRTWKPLGRWWQPQVFPGVPLAFPPLCLVPLLPVSTLGLLIAVVVLGDPQSQAGQVK